MDTDRMLDEAENGAKRFWVEKGQEKTSHEEDGRKKSHQG